MYDFISHVLSKPVLVIQCWTNTHARAYVCVYIGTYFNETNERLIVTDNRLINCIRNEFINKQHWAAYY